MDNGNDRQDDDRQGTKQQDSPRGNERTVVEEFRVRGEDAIARVRELVREGNVRRIIIKNEEGKVLIEIPLTVGVIGSLLWPVGAAVGAIAALVANLTLAVERRVPVDEGSTPAGEDEMKGDDPQA